MRRLFVSDVHLSPRHPRRTGVFIEFLKTEAAGADELWILGDLFDYWIGPKHLALPDYREVLDALAGLARSGMRVVLLKGNRDFYLEGFAQASGIEVAGAGMEHVLSVGGRQVYLCHGDYLEGRRGLGFRIQEFIRSPFMERLWTRLPGVLADLGARFYRWVSGRKGRRPRKPPDRGPHGLSDEAVLARFHQGADVIVCGHVHVPQEVFFQVDGRSAVLYILGDWSDGARWLEEEDGRWSLRESGGNADDRA